MAYNKTFLDAEVHPGISVTLHWIAHQMVLWLNN